MRILQKMVVKVLNVEMKAPVGLSLNRVLVGCFDRMALSNDS
jgi:hypothetical protein